MARYILPTLLMVVSASGTSQVAFAQSYRDLPVVVLDFDANEKTEKDKNEPDADKNGKDKDKDEDDKPKPCKCKQPPKTLFEWAIGHEPCEEEEDEEEDEEEFEEPPLASDRPDFTEASINVGLGRVQLEMGYTYTRDREGSTVFRGHSYPEMLLRIGMFAEWFELRVGQNFGNQRTFTEAFVDGAHGAEDMYLGIGLNLTEQKGCLPEMRLLLQTLVPNGSEDLSDDRLLPGISLLYGWDITDNLTFAGSTQANRAVDDADEYYVEVAQSLTVGYTIIGNLNGYTEWFAFFPTSAIDAFAEHYANTGLTYLVTKDLQFDVRVGFGLNPHADDLFAGAGMVRRW